MTSPEPTSSVADQVGEFLALCEIVTHACALCVFNACLTAAGPPEDDGLERRLRLHIECADACAAASVDLPPLGGPGGDEDARLALITRCRRACLALVKSGHNGPATGRSPCATSAWRCAAAATRLLDHRARAVAPMSQIPRMPSRRR
jgi:hypothetical protein